MESAELEERALAWCLRTDDGMAQLGPYLRPEHFDVDAYKALYKLAQSAWRKRRAVLTQRELLYLCDKASARVGPVAGSTFKAYVTKVYATDVTAITYDHVVESLTRTEFASLAADAVSQPVDEFVDAVRGKVELLHPLLQGATEKAFHSLEDAYLGAQDDVVDEREGLSLGFDRIDQKIRGRKMLPGEMVEILALTNGGKTAFMVGALCYNLLRQGKRVAYFSLDVAKEEIESRLYARMTGMSLDEPFTKKERAMAVAEARARYGLDPQAWTVIEAPAMKHTVAGLKQILRNVVQRTGPMDAVFVDYGQQVKSTSKYDKQYAAAGEVFSELQGWAKEDDFVLFTAAQVHRKGYDEDIITLKNIADGFNMTWPAQLILSVNQTRDERRAGDVTPARIALLKNTKGRSQLVYPFRVQFSTMEWEDDLSQNVAEIEGAPKKVEGGGNRPLKRDEQPATPMIRPKRPLLGRREYDDMIVEQGENNGSDAPSD